MVVIVIVIVICGVDMIGIKKNEINNKSIEIIKDLNELVKLDNGLWRLEINVFGKWMFIKKKNKILRWWKSGLIER